MYGIFAYVYHKNQPNVGKYWWTHHTWLVWESHSCGQIKTLSTGSPSTRPMNHKNGNESMTHRIHGTPAFICLYTNKSWLNWYCYTSTCTVGKCISVPWICHGWYCWWFRNPANQLRLVVYPGCKHKSTTLEKYEASALPVQATLQAFWFRCDRFW